MKRIPVLVFRGGLLECQVLRSECAHSGECANHSSAGDFRCESGVRPVLMELSGEEALVINSAGGPASGYVGCITCELPESKTSYGSAVLLEDVTNPTSQGETLDLGTLKFINPAATNVLDVMRERLTKNFGVTVVGPRVSLRFYDSEGNFMSVNMIVTSVSDERYFCTEEDK